MIKNIQYFHTYVYKFSNQLWLNLTHMGTLNVKFGDHMRHSTIFEGEY
jgi:hypothetical protein